LGGRGARAPPRKAVGALLRPASRASLRDGVLPLKNTPSASRRLAFALRLREDASADKRKRLDARTLARLARPLAIVYTDTDDFTRRVARHGILHFLMAFARAVRTLRPLVTRAGGRLVKVEADSLLLAFPDAARACAAVLAMNAALDRANRGRPASEQVAFSYGIGFGEVLDLGDDLLGLEVNLASKLGEDRARRSEVLLTPGAVGALPPAWRRRLSPAGVARFASRPMPVARLRPGRRAARP
jgi:class 3 adenylate cyclase